MAKVAIIMGSMSDKDKVKPAVDMLHDLGIDCSFNIYSAHRTLAELTEFIKEVDKSNEFEVIIAAAGMSAALPGIIAAQTIKPVIGVPLSSSVLDGTDALLSITQMPPGIPVASMGINAAKNAALQAASIIALHDEAVQKALLSYRLEQKDKVLKADEELQSQKTAYVQKYPIPTAQEIGEMSRGSV